MYLAYALMAVGLPWRWGRHVARQDPSLVLLAGAWLALSVGIDQIAGPRARPRPTVTASTPRPFRATSLRPPSRRR